MKAGGSVLAAVLAVLLAGCAAGVRTTLYRPAYPPTEAVDIYRTRVPDRPYIEIGEIRTEAGEGALDRLVEKARAVGADGLIILGERVEGTYYPYGGPFWTLGLGFGTGMYPFGTFGYGASVYSDLVAVAIRYR